MSYYPLFLDLNDRPCVVIGGGRIAADKTHALLEARARVTVVAQDLIGSLADLAAVGRIKHAARLYQAGDLAGSVLAISATDDSAVNRLVWEEGRRSGVLVNVVDDVPLCDFIAPSVIRQGDLTVAISTSGKAPALAVRIRESLEEKFGREYARFLELAGAIRQSLAEKNPDFNARRTLWYRLVDSDVLDLLRAGDEDAAYQKIEAIMGVPPVSPKTERTSNYKL
ncbi:MAG: bifunctional precorrin-2 dehydrogenase/sirohydrochlorin ferrochelatase [Candidatus Latescibacteria bacterium]|jgi:siroheme synthase-like protein|nr:bifunctional precorrin-2 dehydrogenase/sirohydrochlorin ferrochelatase [Candidatus Latescibacterota bacterium]